MSIDRNMEHKLRLLVSVILGDSAVAVVVDVGTRPRAIRLAMITMEKSIHGFPFLSFMSMGLRLAALRAVGAPLSLTSSIAFFRQHQRNVEVLWLAHPGTLHLPSILATILTMPTVFGRSLFPKDHNSG